MKSKRGKKEKERKEVYTKTASPREDAVPSKLTLT